MCVPTHKNHQEKLSANTTENTITVGSPGWKLFTYRTNFILIRKRKSLFTFIQGFIELILLTLGQNYMSIFLYEWNLVLESPNKHVTATWMDEGEALGREGPTVSHPV